MAQAVRQHLRRRELSLEWLAAEMGIEPALLHAKLSQQTDPTGADPAVLDLTVVDLANIATALRVPVSSLAPSSPGATPDAGDRRASGVFDG